MKITEENVVQQIKNRNEKAIPFIIQTYGALLTAIIKQHVHYNEQDHEECLDDVLLAIWQHIDDFDATKNTFKNWTAAIAKYRAIDYQRKRLKAEQRLTTTEITDNTFNQHSPTYEQDVEELLACLSATERNIFEQYYLKGVPTKEIAKQIDVKESWIHNKLSRGRKKLQQIFISKKEV
jgi:RNA polymerase sigma factor (sigma-70 family)